MPQHTSPFGKHRAELIATKSNKIFTFSNEQSVESSEMSTLENAQDPSHIRVKTESAEQHRPLSRTASFYNGYSSPTPNNPDLSQSLDLRRSRETGMSRRDSSRRSGSSQPPQTHSIIRAESPSVLRTNSLRSASPHSPRNGTNLVRSDSPGSTNSRRWYSPVRSNKIPELSEK
jgi:hypothetical protein